MESKQETKKAEPFEAYLSDGQAISDKQQTLNQEHAETVAQQIRTDFQEKLASIPESERKKPLTLLADAEEVAKIAATEKGSLKEFADKKGSEVAKCLEDERTHVATLEKYFEENGGNLPKEADDAKPEDASELDNYLTTSIKPPQFDESGVEEPVQQPTQDIGEIKEEKAKCEDKNAEAIVHEPMEEPVVEEKKEIVKEEVKKAEEEAVSSEASRPEIAPVPFGSESSVNNEEDEDKDMEQAQGKKEEPEEPELKPEEVPQAVPEPQPSPPETRPETSASALELSPIVPSHEAGNVQEGVTEELPPIEGAGEVVDIPSPPTMTPEQPHPQPQTASISREKPKISGSKSGKKLTKEEEKVLETRNMVEMIEKMMESPEEGNSEQVEDMILELHKLITHTNGNIPLNFKAKLAAFASNISPAISKPAAKKGKRPVTAGTLSAELSSLQPELPEYLRKDINDSSVIREYKELMDTYNTVIYNISAKEIADFRADANPSKASIKVGFALSLLLKELDNSFTVDASKRASNSKLWSVVQQCLSKAGYVAQLLKRVPSFIESDKCQYDKLEQAIGYYLDVTPAELADAKKRETVYLNSYMNAVVKYIGFVARTKDYGRKVLEAKRAKEEKDLQRERAKERAIKGAGAQAGVIKEIIKNSPRQMTKFETKVDMMVYEEGEKAGEEIRKAEKVVEDKRKYVKELDRKKKNLLHQMEKERIEKLRKIKEEDVKGYREYQQELRDKLRIFLADKMREDKTYKSQMLNEHLFYAKVVKLKSLSEKKKQWLEEFQKTLEQLAFNQKLSEGKLEERQLVHKEFLDRMMQDKEYKRELYLAEKLLQHEERVDDRHKDVQFQESQLGKEQAQLEEELEYLYKCSKK